MLDLAESVQFSEGRISLRLGLADSGGITLPSFLSKEAKLKIGSIVVRCYEFDNTTNQEGEVERLVGIGATRYPQEYRPDDDFIVLEDPDGNRSCVVQVPDQS